MNESPTAYQEWHDLLADSRFSASSGALRDYLKLTAGTESPTPYHIWSFLSLTAALCGDNIALAHGPVGRERLNLGIVLTGVPAIRKSTALSMMQKFAEGLDIQYGPTDTAGQRQGIMSAMMPRWQKDANEDFPERIAPASLEALAQLNTDNILPELPNPLRRKSSEIYFVAKELGRLIASQHRELFDFFTDGMDGESFHYQIKSQTIKINKPLINMIGATTPASMGHLIPKGGESHGFLSRLIFVHANKVDKRVAIPRPWNEHQLQTKSQLHQLLLDQLSSGFDTIGMTAAAKESYEDLYGFVPAIADLRLQAYTGRRSVHLLKIAAILAVLRGTTPIEIIASDIRLAHGLLLLTEILMDRSFHGLDTGLTARAMCAFAELAESSEGETVHIKDMHAYAGHLGDVDAITKMMRSFEAQGKIQVVGGVNDNRWRLSNTIPELTRARIRMCYRGGKTPEADEFRTHEVALKAVQTEKGVTG